MSSSIPRSIARSFLSALSSVFGFLFGIFILFAILGFMIGDRDEDLKAKTYFTPRIVANADHVRKEVSDKAPVILKLKVSGVIGTETLNMHTVRQMLQESREGIFKDGRVKAILVQISSPGGTAVDSDGIYRALLEYKKENNVPVYAYIDGMCASGAIYISSACDKVYASEVSLIGSVGVITPAFFNFTNLMEKIGVDTKVISVGKGKDDLNPFRPWKEGESDSFKTIMDFYYNQFVDIVAKSRPEIKRSRLVNEYGAHIFPAPKALEIGFIDGAGYTYEQTLRLLAKEIGIDDQYYQVVSMERKFDFNDLFSGGSMLFQGKVKHHFNLSPEFDPHLMNKFLYLYLPQSE